MWDYGGLYRLKSPGGVGAVDCGVSGGIIGDRGGLSSPVSSSLPCLAGGPGVTMASPSASKVVLKSTTKLSLNER